MFYIGYQLTPVPGKLDELKAKISHLKGISESHGAKTIGGFEVAVGPNQGSLFYIVGYKDADAYAAAGKALNDKGDFKQALALIASSASAVLQPLSDSAIK